MSGDEEFSQDPGDHGASFKRRGPPKKKKQKKPRKITKARLNASALRYIQRYPGSIDRLRQALKRQVKRTERRLEETFPEAPEWIEEVIADCVSWGYLDDEKYALAYARSQARKGKGARAIQSQLNARGVDRELITNAIKSLGEDADFLSACRYVRKRSFGPFRKKELAGDALRDKQRKELAALARSGFSYGVAKRALSSSRDQIDELVR